jgi:hypothetical protein
MEEAPVNGNESLHSAHTNGMNEYKISFYHLQNCYIVTYSVVNKAHGIPLAAVLI